MDDAQEYDGMEGVDVRVTADAGWFGSFHRGIVEADGVALEALHELRLLDDGSSVMLYEFTGDTETVEHIAGADVGEDGEWQVAADAGRKLMFAHARPSPTSRALLSLLDTCPVVVDWPITFPSDDTLSLTLIGERAEIGNALDAVPDGVVVSVERTGEYRPDLERVADALTAREREAVLVAAELGYYRNPREANYEDIAAELDCSAGTVGHHLRNAEAKLLGRLLTARGADPTGATPSDG